MHQEDKMSLEPPGVCSEQEEDARCVPSGQDVQGNASEMQIPKTANAEEMKHPWNETQRDA